MAPQFIVTYAYRGWYRIRTHRITHLANMWDCQARITMICSSHIRYPSNSIQ